MTLEQRICQWPLQRALSPTVLPGIMNGPLSIDVPILTQEPGNMLPYLARGHIYAGVIKVRVFRWEVILHLGGPSVVTGFIPASGMEV